MSRFPGHLRRKGKKRNRTEAEKKTSYDDATESFQHDLELRRTESAQTGSPQRRARGDSGAVSHAADGATRREALNGRSGKRSATSRVSETGGKKPPGLRAGRFAGHSNGKPQGNAAESDDMSDDGWRQPARGRSRRDAKAQNRGGKGQKGRGQKGKGEREPEIRGLRGPVERTPDVVYRPDRVRHTEKRAHGDGAHETNGVPGGAGAGKDEVADRNSRKQSKHKNKKRTGWKGPDRQPAQEQVFPGRRSRQASRSRHSKPLYAALDLGTNNCRLLVAVPQQKGRFRVIDGFSRIVRLGEGMSQTGRLSQAAMDRALEALKICAGKMISHDISRHRLIATEACRQAGNGDAFLARVHEHTGMKLEIIDRKTEAYLAAEGCGSLIDHKADAAVLFDIGGGSSELVMVHRSRRNAAISEQITDWTSLPIGVVTLAERFGGKTVDHHVFERMVEEVIGHLADFAGNQEFSRIWGKGRVHLLGTSGTVTTLAGIHLNLPRYERRLVDGLWMQSDDIDRVLSQLIGMDYDERARSPCIGHERADLVMAGCAILEAIRRTWPCRTLRVADRGLREGALTQLMSADNAWLPPKRGRWPRKRPR